MRYRLGNYWELSVGGLGVNDGMKAAEGLLCCRVLGGEKHDYLDLLERSLWAL